MLPFTSGVLKTHVNVNIKVFQWQKRTWILSHSPFFKDLSLYSVSHFAIYSSLQPILYRSSSGCWWEWKVLLTLQSAASITIFRCWGNLEQWLALYFHSLSLQQHTVKAVFKLTAFKVLNRGPEGEQRGLLHEILISKIRQVWICVKFSGFECGAIIYPTVLFQGGALKMFLQLS